LLEHGYNSNSKNIYEGIPIPVKENIEGFVSKRKNTYKYGIILTVRKPVVSIKRKKALYNTYGAECVDMEAGAIAKICALFKIPFLSIKVISDHADFLSHPFLTVKKIPSLKKNMTFVLSKLRPLLEEILVTPL
jgi:nucleoside phosphorylase